MNWVASVHVAPDATPAVRAVGGSSCATGTIRAMSLDRIAWAVTVGVCLLSAVLLFVAGYQGYGALAIAVGAAAAINLA